MYKYFKAPHRFVINMVKLHIFESLIDNLFHFLKLGLLSFQFWENLKLYTQSSLGSLPNPDSKIKILSQWIIIETCSSTFHSDILTPETISKYKTKKRGSESIVYPNESDNDVNSFDNDSS